MWIYLTHILIRKIKKLSTFFSTVFLFMWEENIYVNIPPSDVLAAQKGQTNVKNLLDLLDATKPQ